MLYRSQRWRSRGALLIIAGVLLGGGLLSIWPTLQRQFAVQVSIADLVDTPKSYADQMVVVRGYLGSGGFTPDSFCEQLFVRVVSDISADGRWHDPTITLKLAEPVDIAQGRPQVEVYGYLRWYQLQPNPHVIPEPDCEQQWVVEVVDIRPVMPSLPATAT